MNHRISPVSAVAGLVFAGMVLTPLVSLATSFLYVGGLFADENGNVGIGTTTPSEALEVIGNVKISGNISAANLGGSSNEFLGEEDFEAYAIGTNIDGKGSVAGWDGPWAQPTGSGLYPGPSFFVSTTNPIEGNKSITASHATTSSTIYLRRDVYSSADGDVISFKIRHDNGSGSKPVGVHFDGDYTSGFNYGWNVSLDPYSGMIQLGTDSGYVNLASYSANVIYTLDTQFDYSNNRARARVDGGSWSSWLTPNNSSGAVTDLLLFITDGGNGSAATGWWDDFKFANEPL